jgi:hypothetical protein
MADDEPVPKIGRGPLFTHFPGAQIMKILMMILALVAVVMLRKSCAHGVSNFFNVVAPTNAAAPDAGRK